MAKSYHNTFVANFWEHVDRSGGPAACWPWQRGRVGGNGYNYGRLRIDGKRVLAHRHAHFLTTGERPPEVLHKCDNPPCCNPAHLIGGTHRDNMADMVSRGRQASQKGEKNVHAKLTSVSVAEIRIALAEGQTHRSLGERYGVDRTQIGHIANGRQWKKE